MGAFSLLRFEECCPYCDFCGEQVAQFYIGRLNGDIYEIGAEVLWAGAGEWRRKFDPSPDLQDHGFVTCPRCSRIWWVLVSVVDNKIASADKVNMPRELEPPDDGDAY
jgi:hypothetical protein